MLKILEKIIDRFFNGTEHGMGWNTKVLYIGKLKAYKETRLIAGGFVKSVSLWYGRKRIYPRKEQ
jgi:hypothetical protein